MAFQNGWRYGNEAVQQMTEHREMPWSPEKAKNSKIAQFFNGKSVFVTGATGFLGKLLVEKLLRACQDIDTVYILVRCKKGQDERDRIDQLYSEEVFGPLTRTFPKFQHKIHIIKGDISARNLGISPEDETLLTSRINAIFHIAATVRFDEKMPLAINTNVRATRDLLILARKCTHLKTFVHVSTAYSNSNQPEIDERFYDLPISAEELILMSETLPDAQLEQETPAILRDWPNTYTFTKAVAEDAVRVFGKGLPVCMFRPAIVIATYREPLRSWIDNLYGATGICVGAGTGLLKTIHCDEDKSAEVVPADYVTNALIAAAYHTAMEKKPEDDIPVFNYVSSPENRLIWKQFMSLSQVWGCEVPSIRSIWYYSLTLNKYRWVHWIYAIILHFIPALLMDFGMIMTGNKPLMYKIYRKISKFESVIAHFATMQWKFYNENTQRLWTFLGEADQEVFPFSMSKLSWSDYSMTHMLGLRIHLLKDGLETIEMGRKKWQRFYIAHHALKIALYLLIFRLLYALFF